MLVPASASDGDGDEQMYQALRQWKQVDARVRESPWHAGYMSLLALGPPSAGGFGSGGVDGEVGGGAVLTDVELLRECRDLTALHKEMAILKEKLRTVGGQHSFTRELKGRMRVLRRLGYLTEDGVVSLKGRAACEVEMLQVCEREREGERESVCV